MEFFSDHPNVRDRSGSTQLLEQEAILEVRTATHHVTRYPLVQLMTSIGRNGSDITIDEEVLSAPHLQIEKRNGDYYLLHPHPAQKETTHGLFFQSQHIRGDEPFTHILQSGDIFRIGDENSTVVTLTFYDNSEDIQNILSPIRHIKLANREITIGRASDNTVCLNHPGISGHHARLVQVDQNHRFVDLNSTNHSYINGQQERDRVLTRGDKVRIGPFIFLYTGDSLEEYDESRSIGIKAYHLEKKVANKVLLDDISLTIQPRKFVAIVGASGTGKSTLLKALSGLEPVDGTIFYNDEDYYKSLAAFSTQIGYVPQDDIVHTDLTVRRALYFGAKLRLPSDYTESQIAARIDEVLKDVELVEEQHNMPIYQLSGGQRKRVSIALELLAKPSVFFLDEPTSGLDPGLDLTMMRLLRKLADNGQTVVLVTHATNNINICDYICFLAEGGRLAYFGSPIDAKKFFHTTNFAEIYETLDPSRDPLVAQKTKERFRNSLEYKTYIEGPLNRGNISASLQTKGIRRSRLKHTQLLRQFYLLCRRYIELLKNDRVNLAILLLQAPVIAIILFGIINVVGPNGFGPNGVIACPRTAQVITSAGFPDVPSLSSPIVSESCDELQHILETTPKGQQYIAEQGGVRQAMQGFIVPGRYDAPTILFIMAFASIMFGCINALREIVKENAIYRRERAVSIGILPYLFSKLAVLGILCLLQSAILVCVVSLVNPFPQGIFLPGILEVYITITLTSLASLMMGLTVSAVVPNNDRAMSFLPLLLLPQVLFSGTLFPLTNPVLQTLGALFPIRWSMAALGSSLGLHSDKLNGDKLFGNSFIYHGILLSTYDQKDAMHYLELTWLALIVMIIIFGCLIYLFLRRKDRRTNNSQVKSFVPAYAVAQMNTLLLIPALAQTKRSSASQVQNCPNCGISLNVNARFCPSCGYKILL